MRIKPVCQKCKKPFLVGKNGLCHACLKPGTRRNILRCYCGKPARHVVLVGVLNPDAVPRTIQLALCKECLELESEIEISPGKPEEGNPPNAIRILKVCSVPRAHSPPKGRKIA